MVWVSSNSRMLCLPIAKPTPTAASRPPGRTAIVISRYASADNSGIPPLSLEGKMSGTDVLWALQKATANKQRQQNMKKKKKKKTRGKSHGEEEKWGEDLESPPGGTVTPLCINPEWATRLDVLENCLRRLSHPTEL